MYLKQAFKGKNNFVFYLITTIILVFAMQGLGILPLIAVAAAKGADFGNLVNSMAAKIDLNLLLILNIFPFILGFFALWICIKYIHNKKFKDILTSRKKFNSKRAIIGALLWGILLVVMMVPKIYNAESTLVLNYQPSQFYWLILICLLILPFQTSLEELLFRGYYMQGTAITAKNRWIPLIVTSSLFGLMHYANPEVATFGFWTAMPYYISMGFILGITAIMDNGLELPLGMHFANNFLSAIFVTSNSSALKTPALFIDTNPTMSHMDTILNIICGLIFIVICSRIFKWQSFKKLFSRIEFNKSKINILKKSSS